MEENDETKKEQPLSKKPKLDEEITDLESNSDANLKGTWIFYYFVILKLYNSIIYWYIGAKLNLTHIDRYFYAPKSDEANESAVKNALKNIDPKSSVFKTLKQINNWNLNVQKVTMKKLRFYFRYILIL